MLIFYAAMMIDDYADVYYFAAADFDVFSRCACCFVYIRHFAFAIRCCYGAVYGLPRAVRYIAADTPLRLMLLQRYYIIFAVDVFLRHFSMPFRQDKASQHNGFSPIRQHCCCHYYVTYCRCCLFHFFTPPPALSRHARHIRLLSLLIFRCFQPLILPPFSLFSAMPCRHADIIRVTARITCRIVDWRQHTFVNTALRAI